MRKLKLTVLSLVITLLACNVISCSDLSEGSGEAQTLSEVIETTSKYIEETSEEEITSEVVSTTENNKEVTTENSSIDVFDINNYITEDRAYPPMWKVTDSKTGNTMYMLGTMHVIVESTFPLPDEVYAAYKSSKGIAVEYNVRELTASSSTAMQVANALIYKDGTKTYDYISEEAYDNAKKKLKDYGIWQATCDYFIPSYWLDLLETAPLSKMNGLETDGVDMKFIDMAKDEGKPVISIEELQTQIDMLRAYSDEMVDYVFVNEIESFDCTEDTVKEMAELYNAWASGNLGKISELAVYDENAVDIDADEDVPEELLREAEEYNKMLLDDRNVVMVKRAEEFLKNNDNYFYMVGTLHYIGDNGIVNLLEKDGYTVERVEYKNNV